jgi:hypothetical protein
MDLLMQADLIFLHDASEILKQDNNSFARKLIFN